MKTDLNGAKKKPNTKKARERFSVKTGGEKPNRRRVVSTINNTSNDIGHCRIPGITSCQYEKTTNLCR